ncbi:MAG: NAD(P)H-dependent oxidoreductase subunit E [Candidatus Moduliflexus flocculans]|nr:NAD(P)H-dependent oxidoreductase subunit E [Candidatus Moduliflexus flocculans]
MQAIQDLEGYISDGSMAAIGEYFGIPAIKVYGLATFYDYFTFAPVSGDVVKICNGTSCHMQGAGKLIAEAERLKQSGGIRGKHRFTVKVSECQGACSAGPVMHINDKSFTLVKEQDLKAQIERNLSRQKGGQNV